MTDKIDSQISIDSELVENSENAEIKLEKKLWYKKHQWLWIIGGLGILGLFFIIWILFVWQFKSKNDVAKTKKNEEIVNEISPSPVVKLEAKPLSEVKGMSGNIIYGESNVNQKGKTNIYKVSLETGGVSLVSEYNDFYIREFSPDGVYVLGVEFSDDENQILQVRRVDSGDILYSNHYLGGPFAQDSLWFPNKNLILIGNGKHDLVDLINGKVILKLPTEGVVDQNEIKFNKEMDYFIYDYVDNFFIYESDGVYGTEAVQISGLTAKFVEPKDELVFQCWDSHKAIYRNDTIPDLIPTPSDQARNMCAEPISQKKLRDQLEEKLNRDIVDFSMNQREKLAVFAAYNDPGRDHSSFDSGNNIIYIYNLEDESLYRVGRGTQGVFVK